MTTAAFSEAVERRRRELLWAPAVAAVALIALRGAVGLGSSRFDPPYFALYAAAEFAAAALCLVRASRRDAEAAAWLLLGLASLCSFLGDSLEYGVYGNGSYPSPGVLDVFWLANYPLMAGGLAALVSARFPKPEPARWLEGLQAAMLVAALGLLVVFQPALDRNHDSLGKEVVTLAYPILDVLLMGAVLAVFALSGFKPGRSWAVLAAGLVLFVGIDSVWATTSPTGTASDFLTAGWPAAHFLVAAAAWIPAGQARRVGSDDWRTALLPQAVVILTIAIQLGAIFHYLPGGFPAARTFLIAAQILVLAKLAAGPRTARRAQRRDPLTGLGNRRALDADLAPATRPGAPPSVLTLVELRGLDAYARAHGRAARDELLRRFAARLGGESAYRVEAGEFWLLTDAAPEHPGFVDAEVTAAMGSATLPDEAGDPAAARTLVEQRLR